MSQTFWNNIGLILFYYDVIYLQPYVKRLKQNFWFLITFRFKATYSWSKQILHVVYQYGRQMGRSHCFYISNLKKKVKCTLVQALRLCTDRTAPRWSRGIALPFLDHGTWRGWGVSVTPRPLFMPGKDPVPIVQEAGWAPGPVWTGAENLAPTGIDPGPSSP